MHHVRAWAHSSAHESRFNPWSQEPAIATAAGIPPATSAQVGTALEGEPEKDKAKVPLARRLIAAPKIILFRSWINVLLIFVPVGIALHFAGVDPNAVFAVNAIAVIPLAGLLTFATECVAHRLGPTLGALMNVSFGNAVELIIFIIALVKNEIRIVQAALVGSILANLLLILGMAFVLGGLKYREQIYDSLVTQMSACLLALAVLSLLIPTAFHASFRLESQDEADARVLKFSRGTSIILLITYLVYLAFQLKSHSYLYQGTPQHIIDRETEPGLLQRMNSTSSSSTSSSSSVSNASGSRRKVSKKLRSKLGRKRQEKVEFSEEPEQLDAVTEEKGKERSATPSSLPKSNTEPIPPQTPKAANQANEKTMRPGLGPKGLSIIAPPVFRSSTNPMSDRPEGRLRRLKSAPNREAMWIDQDPSKTTPAARANSNRSIKTEVEEPPIDQTTSIILLLISTGLVALCAEFLVGSIEHLVENSSLSEAFIGLIILPIVGNAAEHVTAVTVAAKNKLDLALGVALGSSIQIALFVTPLVVVIGWIMDKEMSLYFNLFETVTIFVSTFVVNFLVLDGRSNYLEGFLLCMSYVIIGVGAYLFPDSENQNPSTRGPGS